MIPYANLGDEWSLPDEFVLSLPYQMNAEGSFHKVFYDGAVKSPDDFLALMQRPTNLPVFVFENDVPLAVAWINGINGNIAFAHFCGLVAARGKTQQIGRSVVNYWLDNFQAIDAILGLTPGNNRLAVRFIQQIGFTVLGEIPGVLFDAYEGEKVAAVVSYYAR